MTKTLTAVVAHIFVVVALLTTFGILGLARNERKARINSRANSNAT